MLNLVDVLWLLCIIPLWTTYLLLVYTPDKVPDVLVSAFLYGKLSTNNKRASVLQRIAIPKRWFTHFYQYAVLVFTVWTLVLAWSACVGKPMVPRVLLLSMNILIHNRDSIVPFSVILLVQIFTFLQVLRRCYECMFVSVYSNVKMHVWHYAVGFIFYTGVQYTILSEAFVSSPGRLSQEIVFSIAELMRPRVIIGSLLWAAGFYLEYDTTKRFANFRKDKDGKVVSSEHKAPSGGMFEYVSSPHYLAEIIVYTGLALVVGRLNLTWILCLVWTYVNQMAVAFLSHRWYKSTFKDYPPTRKAIIPFLL